MAGENIFPFHSARSHYVTIGTLDNYFTVMNHQCHCCCYDSNDVYDDPILWLIGVFDMPNPNRYDILSISIFCKILLSISIFLRMAISISISISISIFFKLSLSISISISIFSKFPYRYFYQYRYFPNFPIDIFLISIFSK